MHPCLHPATLRTGLDLATITRVASGAGFQYFETSANVMRLATDDGGEAGLHWLFQENACNPVHCGWSAGLRSSRLDFEAAMARTEQEMQLVSQHGVAGGGLVLPFRREPNAPDPDERDTIDRIQQVAERGNAHGLYTVLEFVGLHTADVPTATYHSLNDTMELIGRVNRPNVGVLLDSYHWYLSGGTAAEITAIPTGVPLFVHINDAPAGNVERLDDSMRVLPGEGVIDLEAYLGAIAAREYDGPVSIELFSEKLRAMEPTEAARIALGATVEAINRVVGRSEQ